MWCGVPATTHLSMCYFGHAGALFYPQRTLMSDGGNTTQVLRFWALLMDYRALLMDHRALLLEYRTLLTDCRALLMEYRALWIECRALLNKCGALVHMIEYMVDELFEIINDTK